MVISNFPMSSGIHHSVVLVIGMLMEELVFHHDIELVLNYAEIWHTVACSIT